MKSKNILFLVLSMDKGGAERVVSILLKHFDSNSNVKIYLIMMRKGIGYELPSNVKPILAFNGEQSSIKKFFTLPIVAYNVAKFARKNKIDTIVSFLYRPNYVNILTKFFGFNGRIILNIRSTTSRYLNEGILGKINLFLIKHLFNYADLIISNSIGVKEDLDKLINITTRHISIPNPIDIEKVQKLENEKCIIDLEKNINYIVSVGRLIPSKRTKDLILAFEHIHEELINTKLLFIGEGILKEELFVLSKNLGIEDKTLFIGNVDNPFCYIKRSKLFVMTSELEGFPNVLLEAMACGLPVISSNCKSGPSEILEDNKYGLLFEVGDIEDLSKKILEVLNDENLQNKLGELAFKRAMDYDVGKIIKKIEMEILNET